MNSKAGIQLLLRGAAQVSGSDFRRVEALGQAMLASVPASAGPQGGLSGLNYDGSPLQFCLSAGPDQVGYRLLADPASALSDPLMRYQTSRLAMAETLQLTGSSAVAGLFERTLELNLPGDACEPFDYPDGVMWLAVGFDGPGCAIYMDARRGGHEAAWQRLGNWFMALCGATDSVSQLMEALKANAQLMSLGIEGVSPDYARAKIYWRLAQASRLEELGIEGFKDPAFAEFLGLAIRDRAIRLTGIVLNAGIHVATGRWADVKLDVCGCRSCLNYSVEEAVEAADAITSHFGLTRLPVAEALEYGELAFVGLGLDARRQIRFNLYVKPFPD